MFERENSGMIEMFVVSRCKLSKIDYFIWWFDFFITVNYFAHEQ